MPIALETAYVEYNKGTAQAQARSSWEQVTQLLAENDKLHPTTLIDRAATGDVAEDDALEEVGRVQQPKRQKVAMMA